MDAEELTQLQEAYGKLRVPLPSGLQHELELRALKNKLEELKSKPSEFHSPDTDDPHSGIFDITPSAQADLSGDNELLTTHVGQPIPEGKVRWWWYLGRGAVPIGFVLLFALGAAFIYGLVWLSAKLYPIVEALSLLGLVVFLLCLPLSIFKRIRHRCGNGLVGVSYLWGLGLWMYSILVLYDLWGFTGLYIGFFTLGYVTFPLACLALLFKGEWSLLGQVVLWFVVVFSTRILGIWIISKGADAFIPERAEQNQ